MDIAQRIKQISKMEQVTFKVLCAHHACDYFKANM